jgi:hypothetical protein
VSKIGRGGLVRNNAPHSSQIRTLIAISIARNGDGRDQRLMRKVSLSLAHILALVLFLIAACGNTQAQTGQTGPLKLQSSQAALSCTKDEKYPSGQRCGFTSGCKSKGKCIVPNKTSHCIDQGGRRGCDGRPVDIFCEVGSPTEYTSAPTNAVGPCPKPCSEQQECGSSLVYRKGFCVKPYCVFPMETLASLTINLGYTQSPLMSAIACG